MIRKRLRFLIVFFCLTAAVFPAAADDGLQISGLSATQLQKLFKHYGYDGVRGYLMLPDYHYPPLFVQKLPADFQQITPEEERKSLFIKILTPLIMHHNQELLAKRRRIEEMQREFRAEQELSPSQIAELEETAAEYDVFTRLQGYQRHRLLLQELLLRIDELPVSFMIAVAGIDTDWGSSRLAREGNNLYKQRQWHTDTGLKPEGETDPEEDYRYTVFPDLASSVRDFALKLNSGLPYRTMRDFRAKLRYRGTVPLGTSFAYTLVWNTPLNNYAGMLEYTIAFYELNIIDKSILNSKMIDKPAPQEFSGSVHKVAY